MTNSGWFDLRKKIFFALTLFILLFSICMKTDLSHALTPLGQTVKATDDTHVDSTNPNLTLGEQKYLDIESWGDASTSYHQIVWLKFSLSDIPDGAEFSSATLQLYAWFVDEKLNVSAYFCPNNSWSESTLTYSNMPEYNINPIDTIVVTESEKWYTWDAVEAVRNASRNNLDAVTIVLNEPMLSNQNSVFLYSKETPSLVMDTSPKLTLSWSISASPTPTPKPSSITGTPTPTPSPTPPFADYWITVSAGPGGTIDGHSGFTSPGPYAYTYTITPDFGYQIQDVKVDGVSQGNISTYTLTNIQNNHEISATFTPTQTPTSTLTIIVIGIVVAVVLAGVLLGVSRSRKRSKSSAPDGSSINPQPPPPPP
jgi:hypothetical protein